MTPSRSCLEINGVSLKAPGERWCLFDLEHFFHRLFSPEDYPLC